MILKVTKKGEQNVEELHEKHKRLGRRSKAKGNEFERTVAKKFKVAYDTDLVRTPQSGGFAKCSKKADDFRGDVVSADDNVVLKLHIEAKCCKSVTAPKWISQAESDCPVDKVPTVVFHQHGTSNNFILVELQNFLSLLGKKQPLTLNTREEEQTEVWKKVDGFKDYLISNKGRIKSLKKEKEIFLTPGVGSTGYYNTSLREGGKTVTVRVHQLVASHFLRKADPTHVVNHIDGNKLNNNVENLEYVSSGENNLKAYEQGLNPNGEGRYCAKLTDREVLDIRILLGFDRKRMTEIATAYGVSAVTIGRIKNSIDYRNPYSLFFKFFNAKSWSLPAWLKQAEEDCPKDKKPVVVFHQHGTSKDYIALSLEDFFSLVPKDQIIRLKESKK